MSEVNIGAGITFDPEAHRLRIPLNKETQRMRYDRETETEETVEIVIEPRNAPDTDKLQPPYGTFGLPKP